MHILFLTQIVPYPPNAGPRIKTWNVLRYLAGKGHRISLATYVRSDEVQYLPMLESLCEHVYPVPLRRSRVEDVGYWLKSQWTRQPFLIERDNRQAMHAVVKSILARGDVDLIEADQLSMAQFALAAKGNKSSPPILFDSHNATFRILERSLQNYPPLLRIPLKIEHQRLQQYEAELVHRFDHTLTVTELDRQIFLKNSHLPADDPRISAIPIAVDTTQLTPVLSSPDSINILTLGTLTYPPNAEGIRWFLRDVFPLVRQANSKASLTIIGRNPPPDFFQSAAVYGSGVEITGYVDDLTPYLEKAALIVVPLLAGSGMRVRILEAFSRGLPVVTTPIGLEGIQAIQGRHVLVETEPAAFAGAVNQLLADSDLRQNIAKNARSLVETHYDWQVVLRAMDTVYAQIFAA